MPLDERDQAALEDILRFAGDAMTHVGGMSLDAFAVDRKTQQAAMYAIATVGEATRRLSDGLKGRWDGVPWPMIWGMRNIMMHEYGRVDVPTIYRVATEEIPRLVEYVQEILDQEIGRG